MRKLLVGGLFVGLVMAAVLTWIDQSQTQAAAEKEPMIVHSVYFSLKDNSPAARKKMTAACQKYLSKHEGEVCFAAGVRAPEFTRDINDQDFDIGLFIVFKNKAAHDKYQDHTRHKKFIEENKDNWKKVRVFDSQSEG